MGLIFCPKRVRPARFPRVPRGPGGPSSGCRAPRREGQPQVGAASRACRWGILPLRAERLKPSVTNAIDGDVDWAFSQTAEEEARRSKKDYHTRPARTRPSVFSPLANVPELARVDVDAVPPRRPGCRRWRSELGDLRRLLVGRAPRDVDDDRGVVAARQHCARARGEGKTHTHGDKPPPFSHAHL